MPPRIDTFYCGRFSFSTDLAKANFGGAGECPFSMECGLFDDEARLPAKQCRAEHVAGLGLVEIC